LAAFVRLRSIERDNRYHLDMLPCILMRVSRASPLLVVLLFAAGCVPNFERPTLDVVSIEYKSGNLLQQTFLVKFQIKNPNDRALPVRGLHADLNIGGERIASGVSDRAFVVPPLGQSDFDMTISANMALALLKLANQHADSIDYELTGEVSLDLPFMRKLPFRQSGSLSLKDLK
jgi:LEA14-like dessication related protein